MTGDTRVMDPHGGGAQGVLPVGKAMGDHLCSAVESVLGREVDMGIFAGICQVEIGGCARLPTLAEQATDLTFEVKMPYFVGSLLSGD